MTDQRGPTEGDWDTEEYRQHQANSRARWFGCFTALAGALLMLALVSCTGSGRQERQLSPGEQQAAQASAVTAARCNR